MSTKSFRSVGWVAGVGAAALGCYMLSLQVAAERAELAAVERRIVAARQQIRSLQTELGTRGRLQQLEQWNADVLALSAPAAGQFVENEVVLARLETGGAELGGGVPVRMASAETGDPAPVAAAQPAVRTAAVPATPAPAPASAAPAVRRASLTAPAAAPTSRPAAARAPAPVRTAGLDAGTTRAIGEAARAESRPARTARTAAAAPTRTASAAAAPARTARAERRPSEAPARTSARD